MLSVLKRFAVNQGWMDAPNVPSKAAKEPVDPITNLSNRSSWAIESIKSSVSSLQDINQEVQREHQVREEAKSKLSQEQAILHNVRMHNESTISRVSGAFSNTASNGV